MSSLIPTPSDEELDNIHRGQFEDDNVVDTVCARRLLLMCDDYGSDGAEAKELLKIAFRRLEIFY